MAIMRSLDWNGLLRLGFFAWLVGTLGCYHTPVETTDFAEGPTPLRMPSPGKEAEAGCCFEDSLTGGHIFEMYCSSCHDARSLAERPFDNYRNVAAHMRVRANLTGKEYAKLLEWMRRWHDVPAPNPPLEASPKRLTFWEPLAELRKLEPVPKVSVPAPAGSTTASHPVPAASDGQILRTGASSSPPPMADQPLAPWPLRVFGGGR